MSYLRIITYLLVTVLFFETLNAQFTALSGGLTFSSGIEYNTGTTGNPGFYGNGYFKINKNFHIIPSLTVYNKYEKSDISNIILKTNMFHADIDGAIDFYKDKYLRFAGYTGLNATALISRWKFLNPDIDTEDFHNKSDLKPGLNLGLATRMYVNDHFDAYISAKYILSTFNQVVINVGAIYYFEGKRRKGSW